MARVFFWLTLRGMVLVFDFKLQGMNVLKPDSPASFTRVGGEGRGNNPTFLLVFVILYFFAMRNVIVLRGKGAEPGAVLGKGKTGGGMEEVKERFGEVRGGEGDRRERLEGEEEREAGLWDSSGSAVLIWGPDV